MAKPTRTPAQGRSRDQNETELVRLRKLRAALPADKKRAGQRIDKRMDELQSALRQKRARSGGGSSAIARILLLGGVAAVALVLGFLGIMTAGHMAGL